MFEDVVEVVGQVLEAVGVAAIALGIVWATYLAVTRRHEDPYRSYRQRVGRAILLGLEFFVAADIIRTVAVSPTFESVGVLAALIGVRTFLSFTLELELEGRWPWQRRDERR
jgi:uncharacterized membrane protein